MSARRAYLMVGWLGALAGGCAVAGAPRDQGVDAPPVQGLSPHDAAVSHDAPGGAGAGSGIDAAQGGSSGTCATPFTGVLATWDFTGEPGSQASTAAKTTAPGMIAGGVHRGAGVTAAAGAASINASGWPASAAIDATKFYAFSITPPAGCTLSVTALGVDAKASGTGPASAVATTSANAYATTTAVSTSAPSTPAVSATVASGALEIRIFGTSAASASGTLRLQNTLTVTGSLH